MGGKCFAILKVVKNVHVCLLDQVTALVVQIRSYLMPVTSTGEYLFTKK